MSDQPLSRTDVDPSYTWDVTSIYPDDTYWKAEYERVTAILPKLETLRGSVGTTAAHLLHALTLRDSIAAPIDRLLLYASLRRDEDTTQADYQACAEQAAELQARFALNIAFYRPEILALSDSTIAQFINDLPELETYRFFFNDLKRQQAHIQSPEVETVLAQARSLTETPLALFVAVKDSDFTAPTIHSGQADAIAVTHGRYWALLRGAEREARREAYQAYSAAFQARQHSLAVALASAVKRDIFLAQARNYSSALHAALDADAIPVIIYSKLVTTVSRHVSLLHRYVQLRQRVLGVDKLHFYDLWVPFSPTVPNMTYDEARQIVLQALAPLGSEYRAILTHGLYEGRWVDVYETAHKRSGAYSSSAFGASPFIMLNWQNQLTNLYTLAHESGHAMHTYFAQATQPYIYSEYNIFVAEVAAICNEVLVSEHLLATSTDRTTRCYILSQQLQRVVELLFWQALFAEFDQVIHEHAEAGQALTAAWFSSTIARLLHKYYGDMVAFDNNASLIWAQFPHFYLNFYVYKFASGMAASLALTQQFRNEGQSAVERYLTFLRSGSSKNAIDALRDAGIDMTAAKPIEQAMQVFAQLLNRFETALNECE